MSHRDQMDFFRLAARSFPSFFSSCRVLEVGSLDINGTIRSLTSGCDYLGIDIGEGPGVDLAVPAERFEGSDGSFDLVWSGECMEHNPEWIAGTANMVRVLRPGGLFLLSCAAPGRAEHGTPRTTPAASPFTSELGSDYYQNLDYRDFAKTGVLDGLSVWGHWMNWRSRDLYIAGFKGEFDQDSWFEFCTSVDLWLTGIHSEKSIPHLERLVLTQCGRRTYEVSRPLLRVPLRVRNKIRNAIVRRFRN